MILARCAVLLSVASLLTAGAPAKSPPRKYEVKSGVIEYRYPNMSRTLWFDDYGAREATLATVEGASVKTIRSGGFEYAIDVEGKTATRTKAKTYNPEVPDPATLSASEKEGLKLATLPDKTVAGKVCKGLSFVREDMTVKAWQWKRITLYSETLMDGAKDPLVREVSRIETDVALPAGVFDVPADYTISDR